jgi:hypothetical protein
MTLMRSIAAHAISMILDPRVPVAIDRYAGYRNEEVTLCKESCVDGWITCAARC